MASKGQSRAAFAQSYGPWALITGASDGIGRAMAREAAARGLHVVLVARRKERLEALAEEIRATHRVSARVMACDLGAPGAGAAVLAELVDLDLGLLAACAGFGTAGSALGIPMSDELAMIDVNCRAAYEMTRLCAERFARRKRGGIILMSSIVAFQGATNAANYAATKAYIQALAEGLRPDLARVGVDVIASAPGPVASGFAARARMDMGKAETPETVARETLDALGSRTTVRPGLMGKILGGSLSTMPRFGRTMVMGSIMKGMTKHHDR
ncbi:SDR family NAD(P)-dependent oxidoreductase [Bradyrhizobium roseum]|uniref:SDR family NAD(P)-dependent oxidoreductase n=1 Tax=Bradyrhizobium roseum TaxID=3056648 RepID=UPI00260FE97D|nr:SDR family NAD(P)-dependent oxidoreductase [Bradyrhizobium roseus]WKA31437.1 SDR family NAD(P)-dependent oxidoreductase [Bradyrhizobium roseus]